jgi:hypothetical protein
MTSKILSCPVPDNISPLSPNGFMFNIQKLPEINFFCQQVNLPGITLGVPEFGNPFNTAPIPGESLTYDTLTVQFLVDESLTNYKSIYNWIVALGFPENYQQYLNFINNQDFLRTSELAKNFSDSSLTILGANNQPVQTIEFHDLFPVALDSLMFQSTNQDVNYLVGNATFRYAYYKFV